MIQKACLTIEDVARRLQINASTIYRLVHQGILPGFKIGGQWRFSEDMLEAWIVEQTTLERKRAENQNGEGPSKH